MLLAPAEYSSLKVAIDKLGDRFVGERSRLQISGQPTPIKPTIADLVDPTDHVVAEDVSDDPTDQLVAEAAGEVPTDAVAGPPTIDVEDIRLRVGEVIAAKNLDLLYSDTHLLVDLARLERIDPAAFAGIMSSLAGLKNFRARDFSGALAQHLPPGEASADEAKGSDVGLLVELGTDGIELFRDSGGKPFASIQMAGRLDTLPMRSEAFKQFLKKKFFSTTRYVPGAETFRSALDVLEILAGDGPVHEVHVRTAEVTDPVDEFGHDPLPRPGQR